MDAQSAPRAFPTSLCLTAGQILTVDGIAYEVEEIDANGIAWLRRRGKRGAPLAGRWIRRPGSRPVRCL